MKYKDNPIVFLTRTAWNYSKGNRPNVFLYVSLFFLANAVAFFEPLIVGWILNIVQEQGITSESLPLLIGLSSLFVGVSVAFWMFHGPARVIERNNAFFVRANYKKYLVDGTMDLSSQWHTDHHSGDTFDKIEKGTTALYNYSENSYEVIETIIKFVGSYAVLAYFNLHSAYLVLFMVILTLGLIIKFDKTLIKQYHELYRAENRISAKIFDTLSNITTVIILRIESLLSKEIMKKIMHPFGLFKRNNKLNETKWFIVSICSRSMMFIILLTYLLANVGTEKGVMVGTIYILYGYMQRISQLFFRFAFRYGDIVKQKTAVQNAMEVSDEFRKKKKSKAVNLNKWSFLEIRNLSFSYHNEQGAEKHLQNVSMIIRKNEKIALIGESGSGKTTFLKIIRELYEPKELDLYLDGKKLKKGFASISDQISLIPQEPEIFTTTIRENITLGIGHKLSFIKKFTNMAVFTKVVTRLPQGFESSIVEKGVNLSGGEKQRLALSRGLLASYDKKIILLDEPTSSVDMKNELKIYQNIFREFKNKTIISSIHRLHMLKLFDNIYFFKNGAIIESGTFSQLLKKSSEFQEMWKKYNESQK